MTALQPLWDCPDGPPSPSSKALAVGPSEPDTPRTRRPEAPVRAATHTHAPARLHAYTRTRVPGGTTCDRHPPPPSRDPHSGAGPGVLCQADPRLTEGRAACGASSTPHRSRCIGVGPPRLLDKWGLSLMPPLCVARVLHTSSVLLVAVVGFPHCFPLFCPFLYLKSGPVCRGHERRSLRSESSREEEHVDKQEHDKGRGVG